MPSTRMVWATGSSFALGGAPLARDVILLEAGVTAQVNQSSLFQFGLKTLPQLPNKENGWATSS